MVSRWDWYQATLPDHRPQAVTGALLRAWELADVVPGRPKNGYEQGANIARGDHVLASVWWGNNPGVHVIGTGEDAPTVAAVLQDLGGHRVTRADSCVDWVQSGLFDRIAYQLADYAATHGITINQQGDWVRGEGRTLYLGARSSPVQLVVYEKGYESGGDTNWVRAEVRIRPLKAHRERVGHWCPSDAWRASRWLCGALEVIGWDRLEPESIGTVWRPSDTERARRALIQQYGRILASWADEVGSWEQLGAELRDKVTDLVS